MKAPSTAEEAIWAGLGTVLDPEFGVNIVDLGLIYSVEAKAEEAKIVMTLTAPNCPAGAWIFEGVKRMVAEVPGVKRSEVTLVFEPRWNAEMLSATARRQLGLAP